MAGEKMTLVAAVKKFIFTEKDNSTTILKEFKALNDADKNYLADLLVKEGFCSEVTRG